MATDETIVYEGRTPRDAGAPADGPRPPAGRFTFASGDRPLDG